MNIIHIIHAVGPDFWVTPDGTDKLFNAYYNSLFVLKDNGLHSISFPLISAGIYGGDRDDPVGNSVLQCLKAYKKFTDVYPEYNIDVKLCAFTESEMGYAKALYDSFVF